ncbi:MAG TPA: MipA/OmpV family protein [Desulfovibrio sp.]|jgi:outer membrane scaffolding protein for murein synthesis (MipA/OmpV family)|nr:MipA/OmpV family protein [Desulfovibrio sp.]
MRQARGARIFMRAMHNCHRNMKESFMVRNLRAILFACVFALAVVSTSARAEESVRAAPQAERQGGSRAAEDGKGWEISVGGGAMYGPAYEGSDRYRVSPLPDVSVAYEDGLFFANIWDGIGSYPLQGENYKVGASVGFTPGRQEEDDRDTLRGMGDIDRGATVNLLGEYGFDQIHLSGKVSKGTEEYGTTAKMELGSMFPVSEQLTVMGSVGATWADEEHMETYFGVSSAQSARSGHGRYHADSGIKSVGFSIGVVYSITDQWNVKLMVMGDQLMGDAVDSPIVKSEFNPSVLLSVGYTFDME